MFRLDDKTALVTGASGGIGAAIAAALYAQGAKLVLSGTRMDKLTALADSLASAPMRSRPICATRPRRTRWSPRRRRRPAPSTSW